MLKKNSITFDQLRQQTLEQSPQKPIRNRDIAKARKLIALGR